MQLCTSHAALITKEYSHDRKPYIIILYSQTCHLKNNRCRLTWVHMARWASVTSGSTLTCSGSHAHCCYPALPVSLTTVFSHPFQCVELVFWKCLINCHSLDMFFVWCLTYVFSSEEKRLSFEVVQPLLVRLFPQWQRAQEMDRRQRPK